MGGNDVNCLTTLQSRVERCERTVNPTGDAGVAYVGMNSVGEVDRRRTARKGIDVAIGREDVHFFGKQIGFQRLNKVVITAGVFPEFEYFLKPTFGEILARTGDTIR